MPCIVLFDPVVVEVSRRCLRYALDLHGRAFTCHQYARLSTAVNRDALSLFLFYFSQLHCIFLIAFARIHSAHFLKFNLTGFPIRRGKSDCRSLSAQTTKSFPRATLTPPTAGLFPQPFPKFLLEGQPSIHSPPGIPT